jgi:hypothetical protein
VAKPMTPDMQAHLAALREEALINDLCPEQIDPAYWRHLADVETELQPEFHRSYEDEADASLEMSAADMLERAEELECGMQRGEFI